MTASAGSSPVSAPHPLKIQYEKLPPSLWEDYFTRHDGRYTRVNWPNALSNCATHYPDLAACADIIAAGDLSEASLNKIMAQGITEEDFPPYCYARCFIPILPC